jgi:chromosome segregation ATPase
MARTNLHELANRLLDALAQQSSNGTFEGKLRQVAATAGLNSVRSAEAIKLLEDLGRIDVVQRGRRGRNTVIAVNSTEEITLEDAEAMLPSRAARRQTRLTYDEIGRSVVDRLLELARDDGLRAAQVDAFAGERDQLKSRVESLEGDLHAASQRETDLRIKLKAAEEALARAEENLRRAMGPQRGPGEPPVQIEDDDARAVLDILRAGRI